MKNLFVSVLTIAASIMVAGFTAAMDQNCGDQTLRIAVSFGDSCSGNSVKKITRNQCKIFFPTQSIPKNEEWRVVAQALCDDRDQKGKDLLKIIPCMIKADIESNHFWIPFIKNQHEQKHLFPSHVPVSIAKKMDGMEVCIYRDRHNYSLMAHYHC